MKPASSKLTSASQIAIARRDGSPASWLPERQCHDASDGPPVVVLAVGFDPAILKAPTLEPCLSRLRYCGSGIDQGSNHLHTRAGFRCSAAGSSALCRRSAATHLPRSVQRLPCPCDMRHELVGSIGQFFRGKYREYSGDTSHRHRRSIGRACRKVPESRYGPAAAISRNNALRFANSQHSGESSYAF